MSRVVAFGEVMLRLSPPGDERFFQSPVLRTYFGGSEANVAVGVAHLGGESEYVTRVPAGAIGDGALQAIRGAGVRTDRVLRGGARLGVYYVERGAALRPMRVVYDRAGSAFATLDPAELAWDALLDGASWLHLSGITPALGAGPRQGALDAAAAARRAGVQVSIDLNYRPALWQGRDPRPVLRELVTGADLVVGNPGAVEAMLGIAVDGNGDAGSSHTARMRETAGRVREALGTTRVALTHRVVRSASAHGWSATLLDAAGGFHESRRYDGHVVDRVGGGDSFVAALLHALIRGRSDPAALEFATAASALKLTVPGDVNRVTEHEVDHLLQSE